MKYIILSCLLFTLTSEARESLFKAQETVKPEYEVPATKTASKVVKRKSKSIPATGNLTESISEAKISSGGQGNIILPKVITFTHPKLKPGMILIAETNNQIVVFENSKTPITAKVLGKGFDGLVLIGEASLEPNSKEVIIQFNKITDHKQNETYDLKATAQTEGEYHTNESKMLLAEFLSAMASAFVDASVEREQSLLGPYVETPSLDRSAKKAGAGALGESARRFGERAKAAREFSVLRSSIFQAQVLE